MSLRRHCRHKRNRATSAGSCLRLSNVCTTRDSLPITRACRLRTRDNPCLDRLSHHIANSSGNNQDLHRGGLSRIAQCRRFKPSPRLNTNIRVSNSSHNTCSKSRTLNLRRSRLHQHANRSHNSLTTRSPSISLLRLPSRRRRFLQTPKRMPCSGSWRRPWRLCGSTAASRTSLVSPVCKRNDQPC